MEEDGYSWFGKDVRELLVRYRVVVVLMLLLVLSAAAGLAEEKKEEWADETYDFKQLKTILVLYSISDEVKLENPQKQKLLDKLNEVFFTGESKKKLKFISLQQVEEAIGKTVNTNMAEIKASDAMKYEELLNKNLPGIVNATVKLQITAQGYTTVHIPERTEWVTEHHYTYITRWHHNPYGYPYSTTEVIDTPTTVMKIIPAHDIMVGHAGVEFELLASRAPQTVWRLTDVREAGGKEPVDMTGRIFKRAMDRLTALAKGKK
jgi:hypothetical protein